MKYLWISAIILVLMLAMAGGTWASTAQSQHVGMLIAQADDSSSQNQCPPGVQENQGKTGTQEQEMTQQEGTTGQYGTRGGTGTTYTRQRTTTRRTMPSGRGGAGTLPRTGMDLMSIYMLGTGLAGTGLALRYRRRH
ncbi:MAG: hypothetical protein ACYC2Y_05405 [Armatimonadota bacterium]